MKELASYCEVITWQHGDMADVLLTQEISDFDIFALGVNDGVDGEMRIYGAHFILVTLEGIKYISNIYYNKDRRVFIYLFISFVSRFQ